MKPIGYLVVFLTFLPSSSFGADIAEYGCKLMITEKDDRKVVDAPYLRILDYNNDYQLARFESDGASQVTAVMCSRSSAVPAAFDYQVILAGVPFYIKADERLLVLELLDSSYRLRLVNGPPLTEQEQAEVNVRLKSFPLDRSLPKSPPNNSFKPTPHRGVGHVPTLR